MVSSVSREEDPIMDDNTSTHGLLASAGSDIGGDSGGGGSSGAGIGTDDRMGSGVASSAHGFPPGIPPYHPTGANHNIMFPHVHQQQQQLQQYYQNSPMLWDAFRAGIMWAQQSQQQLQHSQQQGGGGGGGYSPLSSHHHHHQYQQQQQQYQHASYAYGGATATTVGMIPTPNNHGSGGILGSPMGAFFMPQPYIFPPPTPTTGATSRGEGAASAGGGVGGDGDGGTRREESNKFHPNLHQQHSLDQKTNNDLQSEQ